MQALMPRVASAAELKGQKDAYYLSVLCLRVFSAGLSHAMVRGKWPEFEPVFFGFDPAKVRMMSDGQLEACMQNKKLIRHWGKIQSVRINAQMVYQFSTQNHGFGQFLANWPGEHIVDLWQTMAKQGAQLGGQSAPYFLRMVGKDSFLLTHDVVRALTALKLLDKPPKGKKSLAEVQHIFNQWQQQSGYPLSHLSRILAITVDD